MDEFYQNAQRINIILAHKKSEPKLTFILYTYLQHFDLSVHLCVAGGAQLHLLAGAVAAPPIIASSCK